MRALAIAFILTLALVAAPVPVAEPASACAEEQCPVYVEKCRWPGGYRVWVLGEVILNACIYGP